jgi:hypothetical protein
MELEGIDAGDGVTLFNLCNHGLLVLIGNEIVDFPQSGTVSRAQKTNVDEEKIGGLKIVRSVFSDIHGLPDKKDGVYYVVSAAVLHTLNDSRRDVIGIGDTLDIDGKRVVVNFRRMF